MDIVGIIIKKIKKQKQNQKKLFKYLSTIIETFINSIINKEYMKKIEQLYREVLYQCLEEKRNIFTQKELSIKLNISLSTANYALKPLKNMGAIKVNLKNFNIINKKKILYYWASIRNLNKDIIYQTRVGSIQEIEKSMPNDVIFAAYSAYKFKFKDAPADYSEVYVYSDNPKEIEKRFPKNNKPANLFVLKKDNNLKKITIGNLFVDLWNLKEWYAKDFLKALEEKINGILE